MSSSSLSSSVVNEILLLNNEGVCLLQEQEQNQTENAIARFTQAMYLASEVLPREFAVTGNNNSINNTANDDDDEDCFLDAYNNNDNEVPVVALVSIGETPVTTRLVTSNNNNVADNDYAMFDRAFLFTGNAFGRVHNEVVLDAVLLYNVGIAYHRLAVTTANNKRESLQNAHAALRCYKYGINLIRHANDNDNHHNPMQQEQQQESLFLLALATLNNLAHLFWFSSGPADAVVCREMLDALLESWHIPESSIMSKEDVDFFYFGKVCRDASVVMATAAAAA